ncbi:glycosyltransferase family 4 protein [Acinetobacter sp. YH1901136]|uniref:glycosyltransferase family 4 protein n=1 Tax=Acinetobacter sp. YH1901136 TaxID=2601200 RepID=UPI0015D2F1EB|nr:glycosyltransferase family 4 protein [Acinetobacter sp. YH1901136]
MKILFVINSLKSRSGTERVAISLANYLSNFPNSEIMIANRDTDRKNAAYPVMNNVKIIDLDGSYLSFFHKLKQNVKQNKYDFVVVHNMGRLSLLCLFLSNFVKIISFEHSSFISRSVLVRFFSKIFYYKIHKVVVLTKNEFQNFSHIHKKVIHVPNFTSYYDSSRQMIEKNKNIVLSVGRLDSNKNIIHVLKAWHKKIDILHNWELHIYGEGDQKNFLLNFVEENSISNIYFKGVIENPELAYESAKIFVMTSKFEGLPMVLIEAQCFGLPIVAYNCPYGPSDVIDDGKNGFLVENQNVDAFAEALEKLITSKSLIKEFTEKSLLNSENYKPEKIVNIWINQVFKG